MGSIRLENKADMIFTLGEYAQGISVPRDIGVRLQCLLEGIIHSAKAAFHYLAKLYTKGITLAYINFTEQSDMTLPKLNKWSADERVHSEVAERNKELAKNYFKAIFNPAPNIINLIAL